MFIGSTTPLEDTDVYASPATPTDRADYIVGSIYADVDGRIYIEQSADGTNWDISTGYDVTGDDGKGFSEPLFLPLVRIRFHNNGGADQDEFRLSARFSSAGPR